MIVEGTFSVIKRRKVNDRESLVHAYIFPKIVVSDIIIKRGYDIQEDSVFDSLLQLCYDEDIPYKVMKLCHILKVSTESTKELRDEVELKSTYFKHYTEYELYNKTQNMVMYKGDDIKKATDVLNEFKKVTEEGEET